MSHKKNQNNQIDEIQINIARNNNIFVTDDLIYRAEIPVSVFSSKKYNF